MTVTLFVSILTFGAAITGLFTQAIKKCYENANKAYSANVVALANAIIVGIGGTAVAYLLLGIPWTVNNIICMFLMAIAIWLGAMLGYDKIIQLVKQISDNKEV